jgi:uncharacterized OB-fold protein
MTERTQSGLPAPPPGDLTLPFWQRSAQGQLVMQKCSNCRHIRFPIGPVCTRCLADESVWMPLSGKGTVLAHLVFHRAYDQAWKNEVPYSVVMVQLAEGPRMFSNLHDPEKRFVGMDLVGRAVEVWFDGAGPDLAVPRFRVADDG